MSQPGIELVGSVGVLWRYPRPEGLDIEVAPPRIEIDGQLVVLTGALPVSGEHTLRNGAVESTFEGAVSDDDDLRLRFVVRTASDNAVVRFRYELASTSERRLTRSTGVDAVRLAGVTVPTRDAVEVRLSDYNSLVHSYVPTEMPLTEREFAAEQLVMGPILTWPTETGHALLAYEHGSQYPDAYLCYRLGTEPGGAARMELVGMKGTYLTGQDLRNGFTTVWMELAAAPDRTALQQSYRDFVLRYLSLSRASRDPLIFYNTWNYQERVHGWTGRPYLADMSADRMLTEIDVAHRIGVDVFVIDTGWYDRTGDWRVDLQRFPDGLGPIKERLDSYGMRLGLWFGPTSAAVSSNLLARNADNRMSWHGERPPARAIWETEESEELCLVSSYADDFADELIRCARELGVTYFKWDAISQYGCDDPHHDHGSIDNTAAERADSYAFNQPLAMAAIAEKVTAAIPEAIVDFDVTESQRCVGLAFLTAGKYFLINNGPYYQSFDVPIDKDVHWDNPNLFFFPGPARDWVCRTPLTYDTWIPSVLFLTHYLPDDPASNQAMTVGSLMLGQNGIWGDLLGISADGVARLGRILAAYKQVRDDVTSATLIRSGVVGGMVESYEKIEPATGRGVLVIFANNVRDPFGPEHPMTTELVTQAVVSRDAVASGDVDVRYDSAGRAVVVARFGETGAAVIVFGATE